MKIKAHIARLVCLIVSCMLLNTYFISLGAETWQLCIFDVLYNLLWPWKWLEVEPLDKKLIPIETKDEEDKKEL